MALKRIVKSVPNASAKTPNGVKVIANVRGRRAIIVQGGRQPITPGTLNGANVPTRPAYAVIVRGGRQPF